jgi:hypothetical protein
VLRFVGRVAREKAPSANVVGVVLDDARDPVRFKSAKGFYGEVRVLNCPDGYGFVCTVATMEKSILRVSVEGVESWVCHSCHHANATPKIDSVLSYLELSLPQLDQLVRCEQCSTVRVWHCPHPTCAGLAPLEVAEIGLAPETTKERFRTTTASGVRSPKAHRDRVTSMLETFTCPRCLRPPTEYWPCPQCDSVNTGAVARRCVLPLPLHQPFADLSPRLCSGDTHHLSACTVPTCCPPMFHVRLMLAYALWCLQTCTA